MHIAFFNRSFYPETAATSQLLLELCEGLTRDHGCRVSVVAGVPLGSGEHGARSREQGANGEEQSAKRKGQSAGYWEKNGEEQGARSGETEVRDQKSEVRSQAPCSMPHAPSCYRGGILSRERHGEIEILRARGSCFPKTRFIGRFSNYVSYFLSACYAGLKLERPDVVVALTDPPIIGLAGYLAARRFRVPLVMYYQDIFPEAGRLLEDFHSAVVDRALEKVNRLLVRKAQRIVALGETMQRRLIEGKAADVEKTAVIHNWADCAEIVPGPKCNPFSESNGLADKFVVMHSGNLGLSQAPEILLGAATRLRHIPDLEMVIVGEGVKKAALVEHVRQSSLQNVRFLPFQPKEALKESFAAADVFVVSLKRGLAGVIVPSKLYGILAAGRPYVAAVEEECEVAEITREYECGLVAEPENPEDLAEKILVLYRDRDLARRMGENARRAALKFDRKVGVRAYYEMLRGVAAEKKQGAGSKEPGRTSKEQWAKAGEQATKGYERGAWSKEQEAGTKEEVRDRRSEVSGGKIGSRDQRSE